MVSDPLQVLSPRVPAEAEAAVEEHMCISNAPDRQPRYAQSERNPTTTAYLVPESVHMHLVQSKCSENEDEEDYGGCLLIPGVQHHIPTCMWNRPRIQHAADRPRSIFLSSNAGLQVRHCR